MNCLLSTGHHAVQFRQKIRLLFGVLCIKAVINIVVFSDLLFYPYASNKSQYITKIMKPKYQEVLNSITLFLQNCDSDVV
jgi:hypothetical protein